MAGVFVLTAFTLLLQLHPAFLSSNWSVKRLLLFVALVSYGLVPAIHWVYLYKGLSNPVVRVGTTTYIYINYEKLRLMDFL